MIEAVETLRDQAEGSPLLAAGDDLGKALDVAQRLVTEVGVSAMGRRQPLLAAGHYLGKALDVARRLVTEVGVRGIDHGEWQSATLNTARLAWSFNHPFGNIII